jgi:hypothetical protein
VHPTKALQVTDQAVEDADTPSEENEEGTLRVQGVRLMELTDRDSSVMKVAAAGEHALWDPVINTFRAFGEWHDLSLRAGVSVVPEYSYAETFIGMANQNSRDFLLLPWSESGTLADPQNGLEVDVAGRFANGAYTRFVSDILERVPNHVGILIERSPQARAGTPKRSTTAMSIQKSAWSRPVLGNQFHHIVLPFFGGQDDRFALRFVLQLCQHDQVTATIIQFPASSAASGSTGDHQTDLVLFETLRDSLPEEMSERVVFQRSTTSGTISDTAAVALAAVRTELGQASRKANNIVVLGRHRNAVETIGESSLDDGIGHDTRRTLGQVATTMVHPDSQINGSILVLQAGAGSAFPNQDQ